MSRVSVVEQISSKFVIYKCPKKSLIMKDSLWGEGRVDTFIGHEHVFARYFRQSVCINFALLF
jgi:hypothetical protein